MEGESLPLSAPPPAESSDVAARMDRARAELTARAGDHGRLFATVGSIIRDSVDYIVDAPTLRRYSIKDLDPDEKTAIGKRIERMLRFQLKIPKGRGLDISLGGEDVDIKTTIGDTWMFSKSSHGYLHLLIAYSEEKATFSIGLAYVHDEHLRKGGNRDRKRSLKEAAKENISWLVENHPYPENFLARLPQGLLDTLALKASGMQRVLQLLRSVTGKPIPRHAICSVANQRDPMRRTRSNGGARDVLWAEGLLVLSGKYADDKTIVREALKIELAKTAFLTLRASDKRLNDDLLRLYQRSHSLPLLTSHSS